jgi:uncharacterized protein (TIRG00374 family)
MILLSLCFLYFFLKSVQWEHMPDYLVDVDMKYLIAFILLTPLHLVTRAVRWNYLLMHEKSDISFFSRFAANAVGFTVTYILPGRLGELVKPMYLSRKENIPDGFVLGTVVVERIFDIFAICFLLGGFFLFKPFYPALLSVNQQAYSQVYFSGLVGLSIASIMLVVTLSLYFFKKKTLTVIGFLLKPFPKQVSIKIETFFNEFVDGLKIFYSIGNLLMYILMSFVVWICIITYFWVFFLAYHISAPFLLCFPYTFLLLIGASIPTPGMVGGFHYFSKLGMTSLLNIEETLAVGMTLVLHAIQVVVICLIGFFVLWKDGVSFFQVVKLNNPRL